MIADSGSRREFESGAVRDVDEGKGRCDLLPLDVIGEMWHDPIMTHLNTFIRRGDLRELDVVIHACVDQMFNNTETALLEVAVHYAEGLAKYGERNWEKGIPGHCYVDSFIRHYLKCLRGDKDERHDRAALWNLLGLKWTLKHKPDMNDLPFAQGKTEPEKRSATFFGIPVDDLLGDFEI